MIKKNPIILAIESSCDDTSVAILRGPKILSNIVYNQDIHKQFGGVVPEPASREHQLKILPVVKQAIQQANIKKSDIDAIAATSGPGLLGSLLVGFSFAKGLALALNVPLIAVNHMIAHIMSNFITDEKNSNTPSMPLLSLTVSGGHTQLVKMDNIQTFKVLGETLDDAIGEAFDKIAKMLGFAYPGGIYIDMYAKKGNPKRYNFPHPKVNGYNFSFSGIKTGFMYFLQKECTKNTNFIKENIHDICASIQSVLVDIVLQKMKKAILNEKTFNICISGGVSANSLLREKIVSLAKELDCKVFMPKITYCTDNAAMIGIAGYYKYLDSDFSSQSISPNPRQKIQ